MHSSKSSHVTIALIFLSLAVILLLIFANIPFSALAAPYKESCTTQAPIFQPPTNTPDNQVAPVTTATLSPVASAAKPCASPTNTQPSTPTLIGSPGTSIPFVRETTSTSSPIPTVTLAPSSSQLERPLAAAQPAATPSGSCQSSSSPLGFNYSSGFPDVSALCFVGLTAPALTSDGSILRMNTTNPCCQAGAVWYGTKQFVNGGFDTTFTFRISQTDSGGGADGFAFVIQNAATGTQVVGNSGCSLGYAGIPDSLAVEFDTYTNNSPTGACGEALDPDGDNHIAIHQSDPNNPGNPNSEIHQTNPPDWAIPSFNMKDGQLHKAEIRYDGSNISGSGVMHVLVSASPNSTPIEILTKTVTLSPLLDTNGQAWVGFTAATGTTLEVHDIVNWSYTTYTAGAAFPFLITVDSLSDSAAVAPGPTWTPNPVSCKSPHSTGTCTLREAILDAVDSTTIRFTLGLNGTISLYSRLAIQNSITIDGSGANVTLGSAVAGGTGAVEPFIVNGGVFATLNQLTFYSCSPLANGGAIRNLGNLTILNSSFILNHANTGATYGSGGAIYNESTGTLTLDHVTMSQNVADQSGGAVANAGGTLIVRYSTFRKNKSNGAGTSGGGINGGTNSTISRSTFDSNVAYGGGGFAGGGVITNSTFSNNVAVSGGSRMAFGGGAIYMNTSSLQVKNSTIVFNNTMQGQPQGALMGSGTAAQNIALVNDIIAFSGLVDTTPSHNLIAGSHSNNCNTGFVDQGNNLSSDASCHFTASGSLSSKNPLLVSTIPAGTTTPTYVFGLQTSSPALNHGSNIPCATNDMTGLQGGTGPYDQRGPGYNRINGSTCDMGSYEFP